MHHRVDLEKMEAEIGSSDEYLLSDAFWASMNMFDRLYVCTCESS